ncbi:UDP-N-acetylmuramoylalanyl-D-glutamyl-2, 6-diaminopimelate--D-alanyl-D-alanine ligase [Kaistia algarum]|uniref:UDP-N-acetylmuramoylalanyl-D-glutamyl-2, 6-diaminopimelate--D-alanyl-D-alanine ligase n=1 Tax=Kaistia algarum TaxID=2083279 RepID=UPI000CE872D9|nr:UDP-N-acetylmuramoylalanyl-D-glutamyl-2,6-diaminopimelate--D-alanyl-D-alanine ligase [Kaistia algarum]MCX5515936.1 UDP-N-acetylmuramoylalanyl-D-glutamyl-2,6-diaminopimelate--D-alanyl-D-alanine ligase [Kaistia algarum]PPE80701.1 UDP-N-acetylmuramoylalanyl-D-glutamyl-2, 6-diaminopimelate--D-alanyl-D-alanine ligase [Kaistia algarum]
MKTLWTFEELVSAMRGRPTSQGPAAITGISIDSRTVVPGDAFFAIRGDRFDGHDYVGSAAGHGAAVAVVAEERLAGLGRMTVPLVVVSDVLKALEGLGRAARARSSARIAAVTGSVGKTTTKEMLALALAESGRTHFSPASFNNHWGVPLTLARMPADARYAVFEIGMNHAGEITPLTAQVRPHVAIVTTVEPVHLEYFPDGIAGIAAAKAEIFTGVEPGGVAILNRDNPLYETLALKAIEAGIDRILGFGEAADAEGRLISADLQADQSLVVASLLGREVAFTIGAPGRHIVQDALAVLLAVAELGGDVDKAAASFAGLAAPKGRGSRHRLHIGDGEGLLIDESYNANPTSMRAAISVLGNVERADGGRRIAVLGDMLELGPESPQLHAGLAEPLVAAGIERVFLAGPNMAALWQVLPPAMQGYYAEKASDLDPILGAEITAGDVVMVKGSNGSRMAGVVDALKLRFAPPEPAAHSDAEGPA